jgi:hypothetical protein
MSVSHFTTNERISFKRKFKGPLTLLLIDCTDIKLFKKHWRTKPKFISDFSPVHIKFFFLFLDKESDVDCEKVLKHMETIDDEASEYGIEMVKMNDLLMAKKYGCRHPPCLAYFRKGKHIKFDGW